MPPKPKPEPVYEPDPDGPQEPLPPPPGMAKHSELRWIDDLRFEEVSEDIEPEYIDIDEG
jgi:hypothetical protein